jgi:divalent metal cation (Fe/Co/Zn/Cd) transporter
MSTSLAAVELGIQLERVTIAWLVGETAVALAAGIAAGSLLLIAFGVDSVIELLSGAIVLWRLTVEARRASTARVDRAERRARWVVAVALALLCVYVAISAAYGLVTRAQPERAPAGIVLSAAAVIVMPTLAWTKRRVADQLHSSALRGDAAGSLTCGYMASAVLIGLAVNAHFGWWWAEDVAAAVFLLWLVQETREAFAEAREDAD